MVRQVGFLIFFEASLLSQNDEITNCVLAMIVPFVTGCSLLAGNYLTNFLNGTTSDYAILCLFI